MLIDSHCHLNHERFEGEIAETVARAEQAGVERMIVVGFDMSSSEAAVRLAERLHPVYAAIAIHPHDSKDYDTAAETRLRSLATHSRVVAIGEIGLDYHYDYSPVEAQMSAFHAQLRLAHDVGLPVIIHCREAYKDVLDVLETENAAALGGVMHCWAGTQLEAERTVQLGLHLGFGGVITFKNAEEVRSVAAKIPAERLLLETDAPYLAPVPHRGQRNEPAYIRLVAEMLAEIRGLSLEQIATVTTQNTLRLFNRIHR